MTPEKAGGPLGFPRITQEGLAVALEIAHLPPLIGEDPQIKADKKNFTEGIWTRDGRKEFALFDYLSIMSQVEGHIRDRSSEEFRFGAAYMILIMEKLNEMGYNLPTVTFKTTYQDSERKREAFKRDKAFIDGININQSIAINEELLRAYGESVKPLRGLNPEDVYAENPVLKPILEPMHPSAIEGATMVYSLKREQYLDDQRYNLLHNPQI